MFSERCHQCYHSAVDDYRIEESFPICSLPCFWQAKSANEKAKLVERALPYTSYYRNNWAYGIFKQWQKQIDESAQCEVSGLFKGCSFHLVQSLDTSLIEMKALPLNYWLCKVAKFSSESYPQEQCTVLLPASISSLQRI